MQHCWRRSVGRPAEQTGPDASYLDVPCPFRPGLDVITQCVIDLILYTLECLKVSAWQNQGLAPAGGRLVHACGGVHNMHYRSGYRDALLCKDPLGLCPRCKLIASVSAWVKKNSMRLDLKNMVTTPRCDRNAIFYFALSDIPSRL